MSRGVSRRSRRRIRSSQGVAVSLTRSPAIRSVLVVMVAALLIASDDLTLLVGRQTYNNQIAELRAKVDRVSDQFLDHKQAEQDSLTTGMTSWWAVLLRRATPAEPKVEPKPEMRLAALDHDTRLRDETDQPASKGYIMYVNSPTNWTPVPLPDEISEAAHAPRNNNIRVEIERAAKLFDVDVRIMQGVCQNRIWLQSESQDRQL